MPSIQNAVGRRERRRMRRLARELREAEAIRRAHVRFSRIAEVHAASLRATQTAEQHTPRTIS